MRKGSGSMYCLCRRGIKERGIAHVVGESTIAASNWSGVAKKVPINYLFKWMRMFAGQPGRRLQDPAEEAHQIRDYFGDLGVSIWVIYC